MRLDNYDMILVTLPDGRSWYVRRRRFDRDPAIDRPHRSRIAAVFVTKGGPRHA
jgi:hypothetical protein